MTFTPSPTDVSRVAELVPVWLAQELDYANSKHGNNNPQLTIYKGGLNPEGLSFLDLGQYIGRFGIGYNAAKDNEFLLLKASQTLGKHMGTARALVSVVLQHSGMGRSRADELSIIRLDERSYGAQKHVYFPKAPFDANRYWENFGEPIITHVAELLDMNAPDEVVLPAAEDLLDLNVGLFIGFTALERVIARPGLTSGEVEPWLV